MTMNRQKFVTLPPVNGRGNIGIWEIYDAGAPVLTGVAQDLDAHDVPEDVDVWLFQDSCSGVAGSAFNDARVPVLDRNGIPVWKGAHVNFVLWERYQGHRGSGVLERISAYGATITSDKPMPYSFRGLSQPPRTDIFMACIEYQPDGDLAGCKLLRADVGDRHEHGVISTFVELADDPRSVCVPVPRADFETSIQAAKGR